MQSHIIQLAKKNDLESLRNLLEDDISFINEADSLNQTALLWAAAKGHKEIVEYLIQKGANLTASTGTNASISKHRGMNPLHWATENGHTETAKILINEGAPLNSPSGGMNFRPIHLAAIRGNLEVIKAIFEKNPDYNINESDKYNQTALLWAAAKGHKEIVEYLIQKGANLTASTGTNASVPKHRGMNPLHWAVEKGHLEIANVLFNQEFSNEQDIEKQKEILNSIKDGEHAINFLVQYPDKASYFFKDNRIGNLIYTQISKEPALLVGLIEKLPLTVLDEHQNYLLGLIAKARFSFFDKLISWFSPEYKERKIQSYFNQFIENMQKRDTSESNFVLGKILVYGLFGAEVDAQEAGIYFQKVHPDSSTELYLEAQFELGSMCFANDHPGIAKACFENITSVGEDYLEENPDNKDIKDILAHARTMSRNPNENLKFMFFDENRAIRSSNENIQEEENLNIRLN